MTEIEKKEILNRAREFFRETIASNHLSRLKKLTTVSSFDSYNPFLIRYLANFLTGNSSPESLARALMYPRILGTSINTIFGNQAQVFCRKILSVDGSVTPGIDIEFTDQTDGRKKYCQVKAGPRTINKDDVDTIFRHFDSIKGLARANGLDLRTSDMIVGVIYGSKKELFPHYKKIEKEYPVFVGEEFWHRLTGDEHFYADLIHAFGEEAKLINGKEELEKAISELSTDIETSYPELSQ